MIRCAVVWNGQTRIVIHLHLSLLFATSLSERTIFITANDRNVIKYPHTQQRTGSLLFFFSLSPFFGCIELNLNWCTKRQAIQSTPILWHLENQKSNSLNNNSLSMLYTYRSSKEQYHFLSLSIYFKHIGKNMISNIFFIV